MSSVSSKAAIPNLITGSRLIASCFLLFLTAGTDFLDLFWVLYLFCGLTDMADGYLARRLQAETRTGAMLDGCADLVFFVCCAYRLFPVLVLPRPVIIGIVFIIVTKVINQISALILYRRFIFLHTFANKLTGFSLFICLPLIVCFAQYYLLLPLTALALFAAVQEGHNIRTKKTL